MKPTKSGIVHLAWGVPGTLWAAGHHTGTDFVADYDPLYATKGGRVVFAGLHNGWGAAYGNHIIIESKFENKTVQAAYCHMSKFASAIHVGAVITDGQYLGVSGATGHVTGPHLHYEERYSPYNYGDDHAPWLVDYQPDTRPIIHLSNLKPGARNKDVVKLKVRLNKYFPNRRALTGDKFNILLRFRYRGYQKSLGYKGAAANGIPGTTSLEKLGFHVVL